MLDQAVYGEGIADLRYELRLSPKPLVIVLLVLGVAASFSCDFQPDTVARLRLQVLTLLIFATAGVVWVLANWRLAAARWFLIAAAIALMGPGSGWFGEPGLVVLIHLPVILAVALVGLTGGAVAAAGETLLMVLLWRFGPSRAVPHSPLLLILSIWGTLAVTIAVTHPTDQLGRWFWDYFQRVQTLVEEARDRKMRLEQALDDLAHANRQLALTNERLSALRMIAEEAQKAKAAFVAKVSHEFRTPLNMIIGLVDLMVKAPEIYGQELPPALMEDLEIVYRSCRHLAAMVNDVLALSQAEAGRLVLYREWIDLRDVVHEALDVVRPLIEKKALSLEVTAPPHMPAVYCDKTRIRQVILNLLSNAARFTEAGRIAIDLVSGDGSVTVHVTDTGPGIPAQDAEHIFEPFTQSGGGLWRDTGGSGLGLSISKQFVELHGGRIWLESTPGSGSTFSFELPISPPPVPAAGPARWLSEEWVWRERRPAPDRAARPLRPRVVLCDPAGELGAALRRLAGEEIEIVDAGGAGPLGQAMQTCPAHAVLVNASSPAHLWAAVSAVEGEVHDTPIIGCCVQPRWQRVAEAGASAYLVKPIERHDLERALASARRPAERVLIVDDDPDVLRLWTLMIRACNAELEIMTATGGAEALAHMRARPPDLVLLDVVMPGMDGWQVLEHKRRDPALRDIPVVLVSAQDPAEQPPTSPALLVGLGEGIPLSRLLRCSLELAARLLGPD